MSSSPLQLQPLRIGLIGAGWVTFHHLSAWRKLDDARVIAICDPDLARARERAGTFGIASVYTDARSMLEQEGLDAVDIASPRETHAQMVHEAARRGLAVLCQKPFAPTLPEAQALHAATSGTTRVMVHENWRHRPYYQQIKRWLDEGAIGAPRQSFMMLLSSGLIAGADGLRPLLVRQPFLRDLDRMLVTEILIHHIDTLRFLHGAMRVTDATLGCVTPGLAGEDRASVVFSGKDEARVVLVANVAAAGFPPNLVDRLTILGETGSIVLDGATLRLAGRSPAQYEYDLPTAYQASYDTAIAHFVSALRSGEPFATRPEDNLHTLALVEEIYRRAA